VKTFKRLHHFHYETYGFDTAEQAEKFLIELKQNEIHALFASLYEGRILDFFMDMLGEEYGIPKHEWPPVVASATLGRLRKDQLESDIKLESVNYHAGNGMRECGLSLDRPTLMVGIGVFSIITRRHQTGTAQSRRFGQ
jgi:hypothetical protein